MSDNEVEEVEEESPGKKVAKKKYYPFGTPSHLHHPYSQFKHLNVNTKDFAVSLATATDVKAEVIEEKPKKIIKKRSKPNMSSNLGSKSASIDEADPLNDGIPIQEGLEPCTKIPCQQVNKAILDTLYLNEVERDEIEETYQQLLLDLESSQKQIGIAEGKLVHLNEIGNQLEQRHNQLLLNVETLETTRNALQSERQDINNKSMLLETEKQKCNRNLEKAEKALATAIWRKKNEEHKHNIELGLSIGGSEISEQTIIHNDSNTILSADSTYNTSYNRLAQKNVIDVIEQPPKITVLPPYLTTRLKEYPHHFDKYAKNHYNKLAKHGVESWKSMDGSLITGSVYSSASKGYQPEYNAASYDEYTTARAEHQLLTSIGPGSPVSSATSRVGTLLQSRSSLGSPQSIINSIRSHNNGSTINNTNTVTTKRNKLNKSQLSNSQLSKSQVKLAPLNNNSSAPNSTPSGQMMGSGLDAMDSIDDILTGPNATISTISAQISQFSEEEYKTRLDPVFYNDKHRSKWGRKNKVGKVRTMDIGWGMLSHKKQSQRAMNQAKKEKAEAEEEERQKTMTASERRRMSKFNEVKIEEPTVKSRSLTMYHPNMDIFRDSFTISNSM